ncbi:MAG: hypothetical protein JO110_15530 [Acetobacteraceae bacterium]|nr:hypothetical protein [Acetobacteraceae bacterium]MBV8455062.1 hypothetical protein [Acetobacteraceae bacterium]
MMVVRAPNRPLLAIDGDSFAHRAYHGLPKTIRRKGDRGAGAIVGFANFLLRMVESEQPRAIMVGWDTLGAPTYRHELLPGYQSGRKFDDELVEQLAEVHERYGVAPDQVPDFIALRGDPSDKVPGARGVGPKGAASLLRTYRTLEAVLAAGRFPEQAADLRKYCRIATMDRSAPLPALPDQQASWDKAAALAKEWDLNRLSDRLGKLSSRSNRDT